MKERRRRSFCFCQELKTILLIGMLFFTQKSSGLKETNRDVLYPASLGKITQIEKFVFEEGGSFRVECQNGGVRADGSNLGFFFCKSEEWEKLTKSTDLVDTYCQHGDETYSLYYDTYYYPFLEPPPAKRICELTAHSFLDRELLNHTIHRTGRYHLGLLNCQKCQYSSCQFTKSIHLNYTLLNPDSQLSLSEQPLLWVYPVILVLWILLVLIMGVLVFQSYFAKLSFENQIPPREILTLEETMLYTHQYQRIHDLFLLVAISKTIVVYITWLYWQWYTEDGDRESTVRVVENLSYAVSECILFCALLLLAHGWCILAELNSNEVRALSSSLVALLSSLLFFSFYDIITSLLVLYIFLLPNIFSNISQNIECLKFRILWVEAVEDQIQEEDRDVWVWTLKSLQIKLDVFKRIRVLIAGYFFLLFVSKISPYFLPWYLEFLGAVFHEGLVLLFIGAIFFLIAPYRAKEGLFWFHSFGEGSENHAAWIEASQRVLEQMASGEHQHQQMMMQHYFKVLKVVSAIQYPPAPKSPPSSPSTSLSSSPPLLDNDVVPPVLGDDGNDGDGDGPPVLGDDGDDDDDDQSEETLLSSSLVPLLGEEKKSEGKEEESISQPQRNVYLALPTRLMIDVLFKKGEEEWGEEEEEEEEGDSEQVPLNSRVALEDLF